MSDVDEPQLAVGKREIAELLGVDAGTPAQWIRRSGLGQLSPPFPAPDHKDVNGCDAWLPETVLAWHRSRPRRRGR